MRMTSDFLCFPGELIFFIVQKLPIPHYCCFIYVFIQNTITTFSLKNVLAIKKDEILSFAANWKKLGQEK